MQLPAWAHHKTLLFAAIALVLGALLLGWSFVDGQATVVPTSDDSADFGAVISSSEQPPVAEVPEAAPTAEPIIVYISGAVHHPDVYLLPAAARVKDAVLAAGGLTEEADADRINLASRLADGQHIYVPRHGEQPPAELPGEAGAAAPGAEELLNINTASTAELDSLPGIGQSLAQRIVDYRTANGPFQAVEDLQNVKGIGPSLFTQHAPLVTVGP